MQKVTPFMWYNGKAQEAAKFYVSVFKNAKVHHSDKMMTTFELDGQQFMALNGGPEFKFNEAVSFFVDCKNQEEVDYFWERLSAGGSKEQCGWLKDKYGVSWQIIPSELGRLMSDPDRMKAKRVMNAMLKMTKIDIQELREAAGYKRTIKVKALIHAGIKDVWERWTKPAHIKKWYFASDDWHAPESENDLRVGGKFKTTMSAKDKSAGFDFEGIYTKVVPFTDIEYKIIGGRKVSITFVEKGKNTEVIEEFETETTYSPEAQQKGWQAILDNFKKYAESKQKTPPSKIARKTQV